jgi:hypothetical protein
LLARTILFPSRDFLAEQNRVYNGYEPSRDE